MALSPLMSADKAFIPLPFVAVQSDGTLWGTHVITPKGETYRLPAERITLETTQATGYLARQTQHYLVVRIPIQSLSAGFVGQALDCPDCPPDPNPDQPTIRVVSPKGVAHVALPLAD